MIAHESKPKCEIVISFKNFWSSMVIEAVPSVSQVLEKVLAKLLTIKPSIESIFHSMTCTISQHTLLQDFYLIVLFDFGDR